MSELSGIRLRPRAPDEDQWHDQVRDSGGVGAPVTAAALVVGGVLVLLFPQHAVTILRLVLATAAVAGLALVLQPVRLRPLEVGSPFEQDRRWRRPPGDVAPGLAAIHGTLLEKTAPSPGVPLPSGVRHRLFTVVAIGLERDGMDVTDPAQAPAVAARVSPLTWSVIAAELGQTRRDGHRQRIAPPASAEVVHAVLDDLRRVTTSPAPADPARRPVPGPGVA